MTEPLEGNSSVEGGLETSPDTGSTNPAWDEVLTQLPAGLKGTVEPIFKQWDSSYQDLSKKYAPFKDFTPEKVQEYRGVYDAIDKDPVAFYKNMEQVLKQNGLLPNEVKEVIAQAKEEAKTEPDEDEDPRIKAMRAELEELKKTSQAPLQWIQQQEHAKQVQTFEQQIVSELNQIETKDPGFDRAEVLRRAQANDAMGQSSSVTEAYNQMQAYNTRIRSAPTRSASAPNLVNPAGGGIPNTVGVEKPKTLDEKMKYFETMLKARG